MEKLEDGLSLDKFKSQPTILSLFLSWAKLQFKLPWIPVRHCPPTIYMRHINLKIMLILFIIRLKFKSKNRNHLARLLAHYFKRIIRFLKSLITNETHLQKREVIHQFWRSIWLIILSGCEIIRVIRPCQAMVAFEIHVYTGIGVFVRRFGREAVALAPKIRVANPRGL